MTERSPHNLSEDELIDLLTELERIKELAEEKLFERLEAWRLGAEASKVATLM